MSLFAPPAFCFMALHLAIPHADAEPSAVDFASLGKWFAPAAAIIRSDIPQSVFQRLPQEVPMYTRAANTVLPAPAVEWVIQNCVTNKTEASVLMGRLSAEPAILTRGRTVLQQDKRTRFIVTPESGEIHYYREPYDRITPMAMNSNAVATNVLKSSLEELFRRLKFNPAEIQKTTIGTERIIFRDRVRHPPPSRKPSLVERTALVYREVNGWPLISFGDLHEVKLAREVSGEWREVKVYWPEMVSTNSAPLPCRSAAELKALFHTKKLLWDHSNQISPEDAKDLTITDIRLGYFEPKGATRLVPLMLLDADVKTTDGKNEYAVLILPIEIPAPWTKQELDAIK